MYEKAHINKCMKESAYSAIWAASVKNYKKNTQKLQYIYLSWLINCKNTIFQHMTLN